MESVVTVQFDTATVIETLCYEKMINVRRHLQKAKSLAPDDISRGRCDFLLLMIDRVLS